MVFDDEVTDKMTGSAGIDWFSAYLIDGEGEDKITDLSAYEFAYEFEFMLSTP